VIKLWDFHVHDKKFRQNIFKEFNKTNPDIKVEYTSQVVGTYPTILEAAFRSDTPPDVFSKGNLPTFVEMGRVMPLEQVASSKEEFLTWIDRFPQGSRPFVENVNMLNGKIYSWPNNGESGFLMLFWNTKLFREAGLKDLPAGRQCLKHGRTCASLRKRLPNSGRERSTGWFSAQRDIPPFGT